MYTVENSSKIPITVLMPVYNGAKYLAEAIESILSQTFSDFEFLIINDGSTDSSKEIILSYNDHRIRYIGNKSNIKLIATLNKGFDLSNGKYIARIDADDVAYPKRLEEQYNFMESNAEIGLCGSWYLTIGDTNYSTVGFKAFHDEIRIELFFHNYIQHPTVMIRNSVLKENNIKFPDVLHAEDYALWVLLAEHTKFHIIPEVLLKYRVHNQNISVLNTDFQNRQASLIRKEQYEKLGLNCNSEIYIHFNKWLNYDRIESKIQADNIIIFLCDLYQSILNQTNINKELLQVFFSKKIWAIICEYPDIKSYQNILRHNLIDKNASIFDKVKLMLNCAIKSKFTHETGNV